jgi:hypothetical protein
MLPAQVREKLSGWPGFAVDHIFVASTNSVGGLRESQAFPFQISCQGVIQGRRRILAPWFCLLLQLCLAFWLERDYVHVSLAPSLLHR